MLEIKVDKIDKLSNIVFELNCITYLQALIEYEKNSGEAIVKDFDFLNGANGYLLDKQIETVLKLRNLINCEDFATK